MTMRLTFPSKNKPAKEMAMGRKGSKYEYKQIGTSGEKALKICLDGGTRLYLCHRSQIHLWDKQSPETFGDLYIIFWLKAKLAKSLVFQKSKEV